jgi:adenylate cyclase
VDGAGDKGGAVTAAGLLCGSCGTELPPDSRFCNKCGAPVRPAATAAEYKQVTVLFADVVHSMDIAATVGAERLREIMAELLDRSTAVVKRYGGTLSQFTGDGIMAVFGAPQLADPIDPEESAVQAVDAALGMIAAHQRLIERLDPAKAFSFRIGINTGPVYAGFFGTRQRLEYTVMGDTVNTAARLEGKSDLNSVLISEATHNAIGEAFVVQEMGDFQLKGKAQLVHTYKVLGRAAPASS